MKRIVLLSAALLSAAIAMADSADTTTVIVTPELPPVISDEEPDTLSATVPSGTPFELSEKSLTLKQGASYQLTTDIIPEDLSWGPDRNFFESQVLFVDQDGVVTALNKGEADAFAISGKYSSVCKVTVTESDSQIRTGETPVFPKPEDKSLEEGLNVELSDGVLTLKGAYYGNSEYPSVLKWAVYDNSIFLNLDINYADSAAVNPFTLQPVEFSISDCNSDHYNVYVWNMKTSLDAQAEAVKYVATRGGVTAVRKLEEQAEDSPMYNLKGQRIYEAPASGMYIINGKVHFK